MCVDTVCGTDSRVTLSRVLVRADAIARVRLRKQSQLAQLNTQRIKLLRQNVGWWHLGERGLSDGALYPKRQQLLRRRRCCENANGGGFSLEGGVADDRLRALDVTAHHAKHRRHKRGWCGVGGRVILGKREQRPAGQWAWRREESWNRAVGWSCGGSGGRTATASVVATQQAAEDIFGDAAVLRKRGLLRRCRRCCGSRIGVGAAGLRDRATIQHRCRCGAGGYGRSHAAVVL